MVSSLDCNWFGIRVTTKFNSKSTHGVLHSSSNWVALRTTPMQPRLSMPMSFHNVTGKFRFYISIKRIIIQQRSFFFFFIFSFSLY
ncbi:hypothetical protein LINPERPRIM_LOCUS32742 [Linum perenne]